MKQSSVVYNLPEHPICTCIGHSPVLMPSYIPVLLLTYPKVLLNVIPYGLHNSPLLTIYQCSIHMNVGLTPSLEFLGEVN